MDELADLVGESHVQNILIESNMSAMSKAGQKKYRLARQLRLKI